MEGGKGALREGRERRGREGSAEGGSAALGPRRPSAGRTRFPTRVPPTFNSVLSTTPLKFLGGPEQVT